MNLINQTQLGKISGTTRQNVGKAIKRIPAVLTLMKHKGVTKIDLDGALTQNWIGTRGQTPEKKEEIKKKKKNTAKEITPDQVSEFTPPTAALEKHELEKRKLILGNEKLEIENGKKRGKLIKKDLVQKVFGRIYSIDENQFKTIGMTVAPKITAAFGEANQKKSIEILKLFKSDSIEKKKEIVKILNAGGPDRILEIRKILEDAVWTILKNIKRLIDKFLQDVKELGK